MVELANLIRLILGFENISNVGYRDNDIVFRDITYDDCKPTICINKYEFVYNCKQWAVKQGYNIQTLAYDYYEDGSYTGSYWYITRLGKKDGCPNCGANKNEFDAVVKACDWISTHPLGEKCDK